MNADARRRAEVKWTKGIRVIGDKAVEVEEAVITREQLADTIAQAVQAAQKTTLKRCANYIDSCREEGLACRVSGMYGHVEDLRARSGIMNKLSREDD